MPRVFSGIQPTGELHLGNYLGAVRRWVEGQHEHDAIHCVVDLHALTLPQDPDVLRAKVRELMALLVAAGLDPKTLSEIMLKSSGRNWSLEVYNPWPGVQENSAASRGYSGGFGSELMLSRWRPPSMPRSSSS